MELDFEMKETKTLSVEVTDMLGNKIVSLLSKQNVTGKNHLTWDAQNVAGGVYFINFISGNEKHTLKIVKA